MKLTNQKGLSQAWVNAVKRDSYDKVGDYSATTLAGPPRIHFLKERHDDLITEDVLDRIWMLLGTGVHAVLEESVGDDAIPEQRFCIKILGKEVSMKPDMFRPVMRAGSDECQLRDYKVTTIWSYILPLKVEWERQGNTYAYGLRQKGFNVTDIAIEMLLRDWNKMEAKRNTHDYPDAQIQCISVPVWDDERCLSYLESRVQLFTDCESLSDNDLPNCSPAERWARQDTFAVKSINKKTGKISQKATPGGAKFETRLDAEQFINEKGGTPEVTHHIEFRQGESKRCNDYCPCKGFCSQYRKEINPDF